MHLYCRDGIPEIHTDPSDIPGVYMVLGRVANYMSQLDSKETAFVEESNPKRQSEFSTGRLLAKEALRHLGMSIQPILRDERRPVWPDFVIGSIAHTNHVSVGAVAHASSYQGLGVDLAVISAVDERVANRVFDERERNWIASQEPMDWRTAMFSAKEAIYKATNPVSGEFIAFDDVSLTIDELALSFTAKPVKDLASSHLIEGLQGYFHRIEGHWLTTCVIPH